VEYLQQCAVLSSSIAQKEMGIDPQILKMYCTYGAERTAPQLIPQFPATCLICNRNDDLTTREVQNASNTMIKLQVFYMNHPP
jgi:hypothetical protein